MDMHTLYNIREKEQASEDLLEASSEQHELILFNDDVNTFDWVIETLVELCDHEPIQAEQCAFIVHFKGKCTVKSGDFETLEPIYREMCNRSLTAEIR
jgi:ATP-dependent Clp protease adaptor protein ClpS